MVVPELLLPPDSVRTDDSLVLPVFVDLLTSVPVDVLLPVEVCLDPFVTVPVDCLVAEERVPDVVV